jgi:hypothetical protein
MYLTRLLSLLIFIFTSISASAQQNISYTLTFPNARHHEAEIKTVFPDLKPRPFGTHGPFFAGTLRFARIR